MLLATATTDWITAICVIVTTIISTPLIIIQTLAAFKSARGSSNTTQTSTSGQHTQARKHSFVRALFSVETMLCIFFLAISVWRLFALLAAPTSVTRGEVFEIAVFVGVSVLCLVFLLFKFMIWLALKKFQKENPPAGNGWL